MDGQIQYPAIDEIKVIINGQGITHQMGKKCLPSKRNGVSKQSPNFFKNSYTLIAPEGYIYKYDDPTKIDYLSQQKYLSIDGRPTISFRTQYQSRLLNNEFSFHRKKGALTDFLDKNNWMADITPMMGKERNSDGRQILNKQIKAKTIQFKSKKYRQYNKMDHNYLKAIPNFISQKRRTQSNKNRFEQIQLLTANSRQTRRQKFSLISPSLNTKKQIKVSRQKFNSTNSTFYQTNSFANQQYSLELSNNAKKTNNTLYQLNKTKNYEEESFLSVKL